MSDVPFEIRREILLRLPMESVLRFKMVCKAWRDMIEDPSFIKAHTQNQLNPHTLLVRNSTGAPLFSFSLDSLEATKNGPQMIAATPIKQFVRHGIPRLPDLFEVASCNGLILLSHRDNQRNWVILNPLTRDCHVLPIPNTTGRIVCAFGIGYDDDADDYKVVKVIPFDSLGKEVNRTLIYSLKSGSWSAIADSPRWFTDRDPGVFLNGTVYWKSTGNIVALHLNTDSYTKIPMPTLKIRSRSRVVEYDENQHYGILFSLDALDGFLILSFHHESERHFEGWVMEDEGWNKLYCMEPYEFSRFSSRSRLKPAAYLKDKRQIVLQDGCRFLMFDVDNNDSLKKFSIQ